ncbi:MAG TPA: rRNA maturation RNase YbeY [Ktedonobacterales bacterium]|nr:rRNA maturation RNase YbeY [Ktedonobacterales bacterium]
MPSTDQPHIEELRQRAEAIEPGMSFAVAHESPDGEATAFGLDEAALRRVVACTLAQIGVDEPVEVSLLLTGDTGLRTLNRDYRGIDAPTDVLSFPLLDRPLANAPADQLWQPPETEADIHAAATAHAAENPAAKAVQTAHDSGVGAMHASPGAVGSNDEDGEVFDQDGGGDSGDDSGEFVFIGPDGEPDSLGDVAISRDAVARQAAEAGHSPAWELAYLLAHGVLHLAGFDDYTEAGYQAMVAHQEAALACAGIAR